MRRPTLLAALLLALPLGLAPVTAADAVPAAPTGADVSWTQCTADGGFAVPATSAAFAIVGVNTGIGTTTNPCLAAEAAWAQTLPGGGRAPFELYVNTQHPKPSAAKWWPHTDRTAAGVVVHGPYGSCRGADDRACAYVYGASIAGDDLMRAVTAGIVPSAERWWLDVETTNDWSADPAKNRAVLEGMVHAFAADSVRTGVYSTHRQWDTIIGPVPRTGPLAGRPSWLSGATTAAGALDRCTSTPLVAGGRVELAQSVLPLADTDVACGSLRQAPVPRIGAVVVGHLVKAAIGAWSPAGVRFAYRWLRDGRPVPRATASSYRVTEADRHHRISVRVTGTLPGFDAAVRESAARRVG